jgi:cbb3-type cytochrome oxidase subunit 3
MDAHPKARSLISWLVIGVAGAVVVLTAVGAAAYPSAEAAPGGYDWVTFVFTVIFLAGPLLVIGFALRSSRRGVARTAAVLALIVAAFSAATLLGHAIWGNDWTGYTSGQKVLDVLTLAPPAAVCLAAFLVELPSNSGTRPISRA